MLGRQQKVYICLVDNECSLRAGVYDFTQRGVLSGWVVWVDDDDVPEFGDIVEGEDAVKIPEGA